MTGLLLGHFWPHQPRGQVAAEGLQQHQQPEFSRGALRGGTSGEHYLHLLPGPVPSQHWMLGD